MLLTLKPRQKQRRVFQKKNVSLNQTAATFKSYKVKEEMNCQIKPNDDFHLKTTNGFINNERGKQLPVSLFSGNTKLCSILRTHFVIQSNYEKNET